MSGMKSGKTWAALLLLAALTALAGCGGGSSTGSSGAGEDAKLTGDGWPNVDQAATREAKGEIDGKNVSELDVAWALPSEAQSTYGAYATSPVISNGVVYIQDLESAVQAINLDSGDVEWTWQSES